MSKQILKSARVTLLTYWDNGLFLLHNIR